MVATDRSLMDLTAEDLMSRNVVTVPVGMSLPAAARLLARAGVSGAPVVDEQNRCVGVLSGADFVHWGERQGAAAAPSAPHLPRTCAFQEKHRGADGKEAIHCILPPGVCPFQKRQTDADGREVTVCSQPHCVCTDWQIVNPEDLPDDTVQNYMTSDSVNASPDTPIGALARMMIGAHIHRVIVVDGQRQPIGVVSTTDLVAALAAEDSRRGT